jgi:predicted amidohydrolase YtcJ
VTHEYTILYDAVVLTGNEGCPRAAAVAYALDTILAVGDEPTVRAISRGDSRFIALPGRAVTVAPRQPAVFEQSLREAVSAADGDRVRSLIAELRGSGRGGGGASAAGGSSRAIEIGEVADLAIWSADPGALTPAEAPRLRLEAVIRAGTFDRGDPLHGPYRLDPVLPPQCDPGGGHG